MIDFLLGVPGKLKTVIDHLQTYLSSTRCAKIDNLDAAISTRAAAATALSTATWTSGRASALDLIESDPGSRPPIASGFAVPDTLTGISGSVAGIIERLCDSVSASTHSYTGSGVLNLVAQDNATGGGVASTCTITIDGNAVYTFSATISATSVQPHVGHISTVAVALDQIPFRTSLSIAATGRPAYFKYRKTS